MVDIAMAIAGHAAARPNAIALNFDGNRIAWQSFQAEVGDWASAFMVQSSGDKIALSFDNSAELVIAVCAAIRAGKCAQVLDPAWPKDRRKGRVGPSSRFVSRHPPPRHSRPGPTECRPDIHGPFIRDLRPARRACRKDFGAVSIPGSRVFAAMNGSSDLPRMTSLLHLVVWPIRFSCMR